MDEILKRQKKDKSSPEEEFNRNINIFITANSKGIDTIHNSNIKIYVTSIFNITYQFSINDNKKIRNAFDDIIKEYNEYKTKSLKELQKSTEDAKSIKNKKNKLTIENNIKKTLIDFKIASQLIDKVQNFIENSPKLKRIRESHKKQKTRSTLKNIGAIGIGSLFGINALGAVSALGAGYEKYKEYKNATGKTKNLMRLQGASLAVGALFNSGLGAMAGSYLGQKVNKEKEKNIKTNNIIRDYNKQISNQQLKTNEIHGETPFSISSLVAQKDTIFRYKSPSKSQINLYESLDNKQKKIYEVEMATQGIRFGKIRKHAKGGFITNGSTDITKHIAGEAGKEAITKVTPLDKDPVVKKIDDTNKLLKELVESNKNIQEDAKEAQEKAGLVNKDTKVEKKESIFSGVNEKASKIIEAPSKFLNNLKDRGIAKLGNVIGNSKIPGAKLLGGTFSAMSDATPVYVVNASDIGGGGLGDVTGLATKGGLISTLTGGLGISGLLGSSMGGIATAGAGAMASSAALAAGAGYAGYKAGGYINDKFLTNKDGSGKVANAAWDAKEGIKGFLGMKTEKSKKEDYEKNMTKIKAKQDANKKPQDVVIKDDKSKQTADQLKIANKTLDNQNTSVKFDEKSATKADENKTLMEKLSSIWSDPSKSLLQKAGGTLSAGYETAKTAVGNTWDAAKGVLGKGRKTNINGEEREGGSISWRNNNPGNLRFKNQKGAIGTAGGFAVFESLEAGENARKKQVFDIDGSKRNLTIAQMVTKYAPKSDNNDTAKYIDVVAKAAGVSPDTKLTSLNEQQQNAVMVAMKKHEGFSEGKVTPIQKTPTMVASHDTNSNVAQVIPKNVQEGSVKNIKNNATNGSEGSSLKNKEISTDISINNQNTKGTQQAINNINVNGRSTPAPQPISIITTGDQMSYLTRLAKAY